MAAGAVAERAAERKLSKYSELASSYTFVPIAFETLGPVDSIGSVFIQSIGRRICSLSGDFRETSFLWQRLSMGLQRFTAVCLLETFETCDVG